MANNRIRMVCGICHPEPGDPFAGISIAKYYPHQWGPKVDLAEILFVYFYEHLHPELEWDANVGPTHFRMEYEFEK